MAQRKYTSEQLELAVDVVRTKNIPYRVASRQYKVPRATIFSNVKKKEKEELLQMQTEQTSGSDTQSDTNTNPSDGDVFDGIDTTMDVALEDISVSDLGPPNVFNETIAENLVDENIDKGRQELEKAKAEVVRLSNYVALVINNKEKLKKISDDKVARLEANIKLMESQLESVVNEKFNATKKQSEVEAKCQDFQRELDQLKGRNGKQQMQINALKRDIEVFYEQKKEILAKFNLLKSLKKVHDANVGSAKREFEQKILEFVSSTGNGLVAAGSTNTKTEEGSTNIIMDIAGRNRRPIAFKPSNINTPESIAEGRTQVSSYKDASVQKTSATTIKASASKRSLGSMIAPKPLTTCTVATVTESSPTSMTEGKKAKQHQLKSEEVERPKRMTVCTVCQKRFHSSPTQAFCECQYDCLQSDYE